MRYSVVIRTLGKSGEMFAKTLESIYTQNIQPEKVVVYIAEGYSLPAERTVKEKYIFVRKGMVSQRALSYEEIKSEYILFLDDDVYLPTNGVEKLYENLVSQSADVIAPDVFPNYSRDKITKIKMALIGKSVARKDDGVWAYKALRNGGYSYNEYPHAPVLLSQLNAGPCFFCRKEVFLSIHFEEEMWLDKTPYALPDDQVMFYKFFKLGYKVLTAFDTGIIHLDAGSTIKATSCKIQSVSYSESRNKLIYWHRFIYVPDKNNIIMLLLDVICFLSANIVRMFLMLVKLRIGELKSWIKGVSDGISYIKSNEYKQLPIIPNNQLHYE